MKGNKELLKTMFPTCLREGIGVPRTSKRKRAAITKLQNYSGVYGREKYRNLHAIFLCFQLFFIFVGPSIKPYPSCQEEG